MPAEAVRDRPPASDADPAADGQDTADGQRLEMYGDSAYGSGQARADYRDGGHDTVIKPGPLRPTVPGGFTIDDFIVDEEQGTVTCPNGVTRPMSKNRSVTFGAACAGCPLRARCTTAKDGRSMTIHPHEGLLRAARAQARTEEFKRAYPTRSSIERTIAWIATQNGRRVRLRYIGTVRNNAWLPTGAAPSICGPWSTPAGPAPAGPGSWPDRAGRPCAGCSGARGPGTEGSQQATRRRSSHTPKDLVRTGRCMSGPQSEHWPLIDKPCS